MSNAVTKSTPLIIHYRTNDHLLDFTLDPSNETVWATQAQIAELFGVAENTVNGHLKVILREGELDEISVGRKFRSRGKDGKDYNRLHHNLEAIISVGYRVNSKRATAFRQWATRVLKEHIERAGMDGRAAPQTAVDLHDRKQLRAQLRALLNDVDELEEKVDYLAPRAAALQRLATMQGRSASTTRRRIYSANRNSSVGWQTRSGSSAGRKMRRERAAYSMDAPEPKQQSA